MKILYLPNEYSQQRQREKKANIYPVRLAMEAEWYRKQGHEVYWDSNPYWREYDKIITEPEDLPFLSLPHADRIFTQLNKCPVGGEWLYQNNGNFKYHPGTYIQSASGCWHGKCSFCVEKSKVYDIRPVNDVIEEIGECMELNFREVFDDSATFPDGKWCYDFCNRIISYGNTPRLGCNMRINADIDFKLMKWAGFRMLLFGIESANQITLDRIQKGVKVEDIIPTIKRAAASGLEPHIAVMFGYPWETEEDARRTLSLCVYLLKKGYAKTAQASLYCPPDGINNGTHKKYIRRIYNAAFYPTFWWNRRNDNIGYLWRGVQSWIKG
jgi:radical SAM superfamily enzyme YgiQ (UPF0313 family)